MATIEIRPVAVEFALYEEDYEALAEDLRAEGHEVWLERPVEKHGGIHHVAADVVIQIATDLGSEAPASASDGVRRPRSSVGRSTWRSSTGRGSSSARSRFRTTTPSRAARPRHWAASPSARAVTRRA